MKHLGCIFAIIILLLIGLLIPCDPIYLLFLAVPIIAFPIYWLIEWFKPEWCERDWDYMTDDEKEKFLKEHKEKREKLFSKSKKN